MGRISFLLILPIFLKIAYGHVALGELRRAPNQKGRLAARTGLAVSYVYVALLTGLAVVIAINGLKIGLAILMVTAVGWWLAYVLYQRTAPP